MSRLEQMRRGIELLIAADSDIGTVTRSGETHSHGIICRVSHEANTVWPGKQWEGGLTIDTSPYVLAIHGANLQEYDVLEWRGKKYSVGVVTRPQFDGGDTCTQAPLTEVSE